MNAIASIIKTIPVSPADIGTINSVRNRTDEIGEIDRRCRPDGPAWINGAFCWLHHRVDELSASFAANPTQAAAEELHAAIVRHRDAPASIEPIAACLRHAAARILAELAPIIGKIFDAAGEKLTGEISARRAELARGTTTVFDIQGELAAHDAKGVQLLAQLSTARESAMAEPLGFLTSQTQPEVAPAPAPAPPPPLVRGKIKIGKAEPEPSVIDQLADEADVDLEDPLSLLSGN